ncbi:TetR family transcriptional regulator C-terminal domain-containing protein [Nocardiopsis synnemataformans]|uniref:TetR family transcriptional regulator C-terminal domain-containing protein n=1 Tax=Nocardiopsis synnemataformans TaxID=61305 RepID=UPI003EBB121E
MSADGPPIVSARDRISRAARTLLPLDDERRAELTVWLEFLPTTMTDPEMSRPHRDTTADLVGVFAQAMGEAVRRGELPPGTDTAAEAAGLVALVDGLTVHHLVTGDDTGRPPGRHRTVVGDGAVGVGCAPCS